MALSHGCGRVSSLSGACCGLLGLDPRLVSLALVLWCTLVRPAVSCCFSPCCVVLVRPVLWCAPLCRAVPRCVVPWCVVPWRGRPQRAVPRRAELCCGVSCRGVPCCGALDGGLLRCVVPCCFVLCRVSLCRGVCWALPTAVPAWGGVGAGYTGPPRGAGRGPRLCGWLVAEGRGLVWPGSLDPCCGCLGVPLGFVGQAGVRGVALPEGLCLGPVSSGGPCP